MCSWEVLDTRASGQIQPARAAAVIQVDQVVEQLLGNLVPVTIDDIIGGSVNGRRLLARLSAKDERVRTTRKMERLIYIIDPLGCAFNKSKQNHSGRIP